MVLNPGSTSLSRSVPAPVKPTGEGACDDFGDHSHSGRAILVFAAVSSMKTIRVGSSSSCPSNQASRGPRSPRCGAVRRHAPSFFARDLATFEEPPECADGDAALLQPLPQFRQRNVVLGGQGRKDQLGMRLDPLRMAVAALALGPDIAFAPFLSPPADPARCPDGKTLRRPAPRQPALTRANARPAKINE